VRKFKSKYSEGEVKKYYTKDTLRENYMGMFILTYRRFSSAGGCRDMRSASIPRVVFYHRSFFSTAIPSGDLRPQIAAFFDTRVGAKTVTESYNRIAIETYTLPSSKKQRSSSTASTKSLVSSCA
jgi:hypothetical protein